MSKKFPGINYRRIPRNASTTIESLGYFNVIKDRIPMSDIREKYKHNGTEIIFSIIRNPYSRVKSMYSWFNTELSFEDFVMSLKDRTGYNEEQIWHTNPQFPYIDREIILLRFEHLQEDFNRLFWTGEKKFLPHMNDSKTQEEGDHKWTLEMVSTVQNVYEEDFRKLL